MLLADLSSPKRLLLLCDFVIRSALWFALPLGVLGVWSALFASPVDYQQGEMVRMMYIHVPCAWLGVGLYVALGSGSAVFLITKRPMALILSKNFALIGFLYTTLSIITGSIWGKPVWGSWWVWDARLTSMAILWLMYGGYLLLSNAYDYRERGEKIAAMIATIGLINVPIIKWSVNWWHTLHQPATISKIAKPSLDPEMLLPLMLMFFFLVLYTVWLYALMLKRSLYQRKIEALVQQLEKPRSIVQQNYAD